MTKKKRDAVNDSIKRNIILAKIRTYLQQSKLWLDSDRHESVANGLRYIAQAEALIQILEVDDCGSVGGFDVKRGQKNADMRTLQDRFEWLNKIS